MLQVYQVCHQPSPWYIICMTQGLLNHVPSEPGLSSTITLVHICLTQGLWSHAPSVPGLSSTITLVHICMTQGLWSHAPSVPGLSSTITLVQYMYDPGPSISCSKCTRSVINHHPGTLYV